MPMKDVCAICLEPLAGADCFTAHCGHTLHRACVFDLVAHDLAPANNHVLAEHAAPRNEAAGATVTQRFAMTRCPLCRAWLRIRYAVWTRCSVFCTLSGRDGRAVHDCVNFETTRCFRAVSE